MGEGRTKHVYGRRDNGALEQREKGDGDADA